MGGTDEQYQKVTISAIPDEVILETFDFYVDQAPDEDAWHTLVHVCRRWRCVVFASPQRLNLRLICTQHRLFKALGVWPSLPIVVSCSGRGALLFGHDVDSIIATLKHRDRICKIDIWNVPRVLWETFSANEMPYPALTSLKLHSYTENVLFFPNLIWGGSAPRLQEVIFKGIPFLPLRKLISSASGLVNLHLFDLPPSKRVTPDAMVSGLSTLTRLQSLILVFQYPQFMADGESRHPPPLTRVGLPTLTRLHLQGHSTYLEAIVSRIDTPLLQSFTIKFFYDTVVPDMPLLFQFIDRTETFRALHQADIIFGSAGAFVKFLSPNETAALTLGILSGEGERQLSALVQVWRSSLPPLPTLNRVDISESQPKRGHWKGNAETLMAQWMELLLLFSSVRDVGLSGKLIPHVAAALVQGLAGPGERVTEVLPALQTLFVERPRLSRPAKQAIGQFIAMRQLYGHSVAVHYTKEEERGNRSVKVP